MVVGVPGVNRAARESSRASGCHLLHRDPCRPSTRCTRRPKRPEPRDGVLELREIGAVRSQVDGILLASSRLTDPALADLAGRGAPLVLLNRDLAGSLPEVPSRDHR